MFFVFSGWLQDHSPILHLFPGNQLLLDPSGGPLPSQSHFHGVLLRLQISLGFHPHRVG